ncbi:hypothetical protein [Companilactobacillus allii]|nr:hypothetical protein [Companilactobacillus allii]
MNDWTLRKELDGSSVYQNKLNKNEYAIADEFNEPRIRVFTDNTEIEKLLDNIDEIGFTGNYYTYANKISLLF